MQCQETCWMAIDTINMPDDIQGCNCKCKGAKSIQNLCPLLPLLWLNAFSLSNKIHNSQPFMVCPNNVWAATKRVKLQAEVFASWQSTKSGAHNAKYANYIPTPQSGVVQKTYQ